MKILLSQKRLTTSDAVIATIWSFIVFGSFVAPGSSQPAPSSSSTDNFTYECAAASDTDPQSTAPIASAVGALKIHRSSVELASK